MKQFAKKAATIMLTSLLAIVLTAGVSVAENKLVVQDTLANDVFTVDDTGAVVGRNSISSAGNTFQLFSMKPYSDVGWEGGFFNVQRARGTELTPLAVTANNTIFTFDAMGYDGTDYARGGQIIGKVDGSGVAPGKIPFYWAFRTMGNDGVLGDRMTIKADGQVIIPNLAGTYGGGSAFVCVNNSGQFFASETACP